MSVCENCKNRPYMLCVADKEDVHFNDRKFIIHCDKYEKDENIKEKND